jgi:ABC-type branched-subunit amino acid transport system permease subunit
LGNIIGVFLVVTLPDVFNRFADYQLMVFGGLLLFTLYFCRAASPDCYAQSRRVLFQRK